MYFNINNYIALWFMCIWWGLTKYCDPTDLCCEGIESQHPGSLEGSGIIQAFLKTSDPFEKLKFLHTQNKTVFFPNHL